MIGLFAVRGASMAPGLSPGDLVVVVSPRVRRPAPGDVVVARTPFGEVVHRIVGWKRDGGGRAIYTLRGDANRGPDPFAVAEGQLRGVVALRLRGLGRPRLWLTSLGRALPGRPRDRSRVMIGNKNPEPTVGGTR